MKRKALSGALLMLVAAAASAHRLDEYLQGTILAVTRDQLKADVTLTPGVAIFPVLIPDIDANADGAISEAEQHGYADRVLGDLSLSVDGQGLAPHLISADFPPIGDMREGRGEIHIEFYADLPRGGASRKLIFENRHQNAISVYQVNVLVPRDPDIRIVSQSRNYSQSHYELDFDQAALAADKPAGAIPRSVPLQLGMASLFGIAVLGSSWAVRKRKVVRLLLSHRQGNG